MFGLKRYLAALLLFCGSIFASAQQRVWDDALDWYGSVSAKCSTWRARIDRGESVPRDSLQRMMEELSAVRGELQRAWNEMTPRQRRCFEAIRDRFLTGKWPVDALSSSAPAVSIPSALSFVRVDSGNTLRGRLDVNAAAKTPLWTEKGAALTSGSPSEAVLLSTRPVPLSPSSLPPASLRQSPLSPTSLSHVPLRLAPVAGLLAGVYPDFSMGAVLGVSIGADWAVLVAGRSNFRQRRCAYDCLSDGTAGEGYFWGSGEKSVNRHQLTLAVSYALSHPVRLYAGVGYGVRTLCWKDSDGAWARVADRSVRGLALDAGLVISPFRSAVPPRNSAVPSRNGSSPSRSGAGPSFLLGAGFLPGGGYVDAVAGFCWWF